MGTTNYGNQEILYKYETPLDSLYMARYLEGFASPGLVSLPEITNVVGASLPTIKVTPFSCYVKDSQTGQYLFKITTTSDATVVLSPEDVCLGFQYVYEANATCYGDFVGLTAEEAQSFAGIILCVLLIEGNAVSHYSFNGADLSPSLFDFMDVPWQAVRALSPKSEEWSNTKIGFVRGSVLLDSVNNILLYQDTGVQSYEPYETLLDMSTYSSGWYYVGYQVSFDKQADGYDPKLQVLTEPAATREDLLDEIPLMYACMAIVHWTGDVRTSEFEAIKNQASTAGGGGGGASLTGGARGSLVYQVRPSVTGFIDIGQHGQMLRVEDGIPAWTSLVYRVKTIGPYTLIPWEYLGIEYDPSEHYMCFALEAVSRPEAMPCQVTITEQGIIVSCISLIDGNIQEYERFSTFGGHKWGEVLWGGYEDVYVNVMVMYALDAENEPIDPYTPQIETDLPASVDINSGSSFTLTVEATTLFGDEVTYAWVRGDQELSDGLTSSGATISGATTDTLTVTAAGGSDSGRYYCIVTNSSRTSIGGTSFFKVSSSCQVTVAVASEPVFTRDLPSVYHVTTGYTAHFYVVVSANGTLSYQWQKYNTGTSEWTDIPDETASSYDIASVDAGNLNGDYRVIVTNTLGNTQATKTSVECSASVANVSEPEIQIDLSSSLSVMYLEDVSLNVVAVSPDEGTLSYQWQVYDTGTSTWTGLSGQITDTLLLSEVQSSATYRCIITNTRETYTASINSTACSVSVVIADMPQFNTNLPSNASVMEGASLSLFVSASVTDAGTLTYQWYKYDSDTASWGELEGETNYLYTINNASAADSTTYKVVVTNTLGRSSVSNTSNVCTVAVTPVV